MYYLLDMSVFSIIASHVSFISAKRKKSLEDQTHYHCLLLGKEKNLLETSHPSVKVQIHQDKPRGKKRSPTASLCGDQTLGNYTRRTFNTHNVVRV